MVHYKLYYFESKGAAQAARDLFTLAGVEFEDIRYSDEEWGSHKHEMPFGQMPVLEVDGLQIPQSMAINRYLARKFGYAGKNPEEEALVDGFADQYYDFKGAIKTYYYVVAGWEKGDVEKLEKEIMIPARDKFFALITKFLKKSKSGYLTNGGLTFADILIAEHILTMNGFYPDYVKGFPEIDEYYQKVLNVPALKEYIKTRPQTDS
ncbi:unnamed protein product [Caenorhabditis auriculariae]|uniref:glutathione transferase n=1 Tax=Caenorhabditis auriculariae TaxID=2777116 RepID=A0A8S1HRU1_9PELO|nr:unnamed protein product [Caenorhabditis auriculariae]